MAGGIEFPSVPIQSPPPISGFLQLGIGLGESLVSEFSGLARGFKTQEAIARLVDSKLGPLVQLGFKLNNLFQQGIVLSSSDANSQSLISQALAQASQQLQVMGYTRQQAFDMITGMLQGKQTFLPGTTLGEIVQTPENPPLAPAPPPGPSNNLFERQGVCPPGSERNAMGFCAPRQTTFDVVTPAKGAALGAALALGIGQPELLLPAMRAGAQIGELVSIGKNSMDDFVRGFFSQPGGPPPFTPPGSQPFTPPGGPPLPPPGQPMQPPEVPILDQSRPCSTCTPPPPEIRARLQSQRDLLRQEISTEQRQQLDKQVGQQSKQLEQLRNLESQPLEQRDIPRELEQKQQLLQQIENELQGQPQEQPGGPPPGGGAPELQGYHPTQIAPVQPPSVPQEPPPPVLTQRQPTGEFPHPLSPQVVKFCVACTSQQESLKFLNGEPSECSVVPA